MCFSKFEQIENEYGPLEEYYGGAAAKNYASWAAQMAVGLKTGVPWVMCKQDDAPDPIVSSKRDLFTVLNFHCINYFAYCASSWLHHLHFFFLLICHIVQKTLFIFLLQLFLFNIKFLDLYTNWNKNDTWFPITPTKFVDAQAYILVKNL